MWFCVNFDVYNITTVPLSFMLLMNLSNNFWHVLRGTHCLRDKNQKWICGTHDTGPQVLMWIIWMKPVIGHWFDYWICCLQMFLLVISPCLDAGKITGNFHGNVSLTNPKSTRNGWFGMFGNSIFDNFDCFYLKW